MKDALTLKFYFILVYVLIAFLAFFNSISCFFFFLKLAPWLDLPIIISLVVVVMIIAFVNLLLCYMVLVSLFHVVSFLYPSVLFSDRCILHSQYQIFYIKVFSTFKAWWHSFFSVYHENPIVSTVLVL